MEVPLPILVVVYAGFLFCIIIHECAHVLVAALRGDDTAWLMGRFTLNPIAHIDPVMSILLPAVLLMSGLPPFGGAKPVPVDMNNFRGNRLRDMMLVALAGPVSNVLLAFVFGLLLNLAFPLAEWNKSFGKNYVDVLVFLIQANAALAIFNMIPIPPLDGSRILAAALPRRWGWYIYKYERVGFFVVVLLVVSGATAKFLPALIIDSTMLVLRLTWLA